MSQYIDTINAAKEALKAAEGVESRDVNTWHSRVTRSVTRFEQILKMDAPKVMCDEENRMLTERTAGLMKAIKEAK